MSFIQVPECPKDVQEIDGNMQLHGIICDVYIDSITNDSRFRRAFYDILSCDSNVYYTNGLPLFDVDRNYAQPIKHKNWTIVSDSGDRNALMQSFNIDYGGRCVIKPWTKMDHNVFLNAPRERLLLHYPNTLSEFANIKYMCDDHVIIRPEWIIDYGRDSENVYLFEHYITLLLKNGHHFHVICGADKMQYIHELLLNIEGSDLRRSNEEFQRKFYSDAVIRKMKT